MSEVSLFSELLRVSEAESLSFLIVGGNAVNAYGYQRTTFDIDVAVPDDQARSWRRQLESMGYEMFFGTEAFQRFRGRRESPLFPVDLMLLNADTFRKLEDGSVTKTVGDARLPVPAPLHLIAMKLHALRQPARAEQGKDFPDVIGLIETLGIDVHGDEFQTILAKYANESTRDELLRRLDRGE